MEYRFINKKCEGKNGDRWFQISKSTIEIWIKECPVVQPAFGEEGDGQERDEPERNAHEKEYQKMLKAAPIKRAAIYEPVKSDLLFDELIAIWVGKQRQGDRKI
jgi:hypothetical protein